MKIVFITTPIRPVPTDYPPVGSLSIVTELRRSGYDVEFYNIDRLRPSYEEAVSHIVAARPDVLAVSAVVSTAYAYARRITLDVEKALPDCRIVLGGNLGASAEIVLRRTGVDFVVTGEGERTMLDFLAVPAGAPRGAYRAVKGLAFLDGEELVVTPFPDARPADRLYDIDWGILGDQLKYFIRPAAVTDQLSVADRNDERVLKLKREGKSSALIVASKGCVARCTFCHRWDKGIRYIPVPLLMERIDVLIRDHGVGHVRFGDENFGTDKRWLSEFIDAIAARGVLWEVGGMRVNCIGPEWIDRMKAAGCVTIYFGMESGSQRMLDVMEKKTTVAQNKDAMRWMLERGLNTIVQLIVGMPGEGPDTVAETAEFLRHCATISPRWNPNNVSVNFAQALPGTPLYEVGRRRGLIGATLEAEEAYLLRISDRDARDGETTLNHTDFPRLLLERWHYDLENAGRFAFVEKFGIEAYRAVLLESALFEEERADSGYFADPAREVEMGLEVESGNVTNTMHQKRDRTKLSPARYPSAWSLLARRRLYMIPVLHPQLFMRLGPLSGLIVLANAARKYGAAAAPRLLWEQAAWSARRAFGRFRPALPGHASLRAVVAGDVLAPVPADAPAMAPLRAGR